MSEFLLAGEHVIVDPAHGVTVTYWAPPVVGESARERERSVMLSVRDAWRVECAGVPPEPEPPAPKARSGLTVTVNGEARPVREQDTLAWLEWLPAGPKSSLTFDRIDALQLEPTPEGPTLRIQRRPAGWAVHALEAGTPVWIADRAYRAGELYELALSWEDA